MWLSVFGILFLLNKVFRWLTISTFSIFFLFSTILSLWRSPLHEEHTHIYTCLCRNTNSLIQCVLVKKANSYSFDWGMTDEYEIKTQYNDTNEWRVLCIAITLDEKKKKREKKETVRTKQSEEWKKAIATKLSLQNTNTKFYQHNYS